VHNLSFVFDDEGLAITFIATVRHWPFFRYGSLTYPSFRGGRQMWDAVFDDPFAHGGPGRQSNVRVGPFQWRRTSILRACRNRLGSYLQPTHRFAHHWVTNGLP
jgi:hypothetical protein